MVREKTTFPALFRAPSAGAAASIADPTAAAADVVVPALATGANGSRKTRRRRKRRPSGLWKDDDDSKHLEAIFLNQPYVAPTSLALETIFEGTDETIFEGTDEAEVSLMLGVNRRHRYFSWPRNYWREDRHRSTHRSMMIRKKGTVNWPPPRLSEKQERRLKKLVKTDEGEEIGIERYWKMEKTLPMTSPGKKLKKNVRWRGSSGKNKMPIASGDSYLTESSMSLSFGPGESSSFKLEEPVMSEEELRRKIEEADTLFGHCDERNVSRDSASVSVRRSSRLYGKAGDNMLGSIFKALQEKETKTTTTTTPKSRKKSDDFAVHVGEF